MNVNEVFFELHRHLLLMQRRMRILRLKTPFYVDPEASNLLPVIASRKILYSKDLVDFLKLHQVQVSRLLKKMVSLGYVELKTAEHDARLKAISFTEYGRQCLEDIVELDNHFCELGLRALSNAELKKLTHYYSILSQGLGAPGEDCLPGEKPWVIEQKRLARVLGMLGSDYLETGYEVLVYQILFQLYDASKLRFRELNSRLPLDPSFLCRKLDWLVAQGLCERSLISSDKRGVNLALTRLGRQTIKNHEDRIAHTLTQALAGLNQNQISEFVNLLAKANREEPVPSVPRLSFLQCKSAQDFFLARKFYIEAAVSCGEHASLPSSLLPEDSLCFLASDGQGIVAVLSVEEKAGGHFLSHLIISTRFSKQSIERFIRRAINTVLREPGVHEIAVSPDKWAEISPHLETVQREVRRGVIYLSNRRKMLRAGME